MQHPREHRPPPPGRTRGHDGRETEERDRGQAHDRPPRRHRTYSLARTNSVVLYQVDSVELGVSLHKVGNDLDIRLWTKTKDGCWVELLYDDSAAEAFTTDDTQCPVTFRMIIIDHAELDEETVPISEIRVFEPRVGGKVAWYHATDWRSAELTLVLERDSNGSNIDDMVEAPFGVRVLDEDGNWWGQDPYVRIVRVTTPPTDSTCGQS